LNYEGCAIYCYLEITQWECIIQWCSRLPQYTRIYIDKIIFTLICPFENIILKYRHWTLDSWVSYNQETKQEAYHL
jgi:hypothetical protein